MRLVGGLLVIAIALLVIVFKFSAVESKFRCTGGFNNDRHGEEATMYLLLERYRWWIGLWSESDGGLQIEVPNQWTGYYDDLQVVGQQLQIQKDEELVGNFSTLSRALALQTHLGFFDGSCDPIPD